MRQLLTADEALTESRFLIEQAQDLESPERWRRLSSSTYKRIEDGRTALRRLEDALRALDERLTSGRRDRQIATSTALMTSTTH